jgi:hypothetical protein
MKNEEEDSMFGGIDPPLPENLLHRQELKIPLLSYKKTSRAGLWLLILPVFYSATVILRYDLGISSPPLDTIRYAFSAIDRNPFLTYLIPVFFVGLPLLVMVMNLLALCHFAYSRGMKELLITVKIRPLNIALFLFSSAILVFFLLPDRL